MCTELTHWIVGFNSPHLSTHPQVMPLMMRSAQTLLQDERGDLVKVSGNPM